MTQKTKIEWSQRTWSPVAGCSLASLGCTNYYTLRTAYPMSKNPKMPQYRGTAEIVDCIEPSDSPWLFGLYGHVLRYFRPVPFTAVKGALSLFRWRNMLDGGAA